MTKGATHDQSTAPSRGEEVSRAAAALRQRLAANAVPAGGEPGRHSPSKSSKLRSAGTRRSRITVDRALLVRLSSALAVAMTKSGHLAQRVTHEHLGYCGWRSESKLCVEHRALIADVDAALGRE